MSADKSFRGTLLLLQNKTKRDPESYVDEFRTQLKHFQAVTTAILSGAGLGAANTAEASSPQFLAVMSFVCHVAHCYPAECEGLPDLLIDLLRTGKASLPTDTRLAIVNSLLLLRNKNIASAEKTMPVLFELLEARDKGLRKVILAHVVGDVRRINLPGAKEGSARVNKQIQAFLFKIMEDDDAVQARSALTVMIDLYRRQLWCNDRTVQVIATACFSKHTLILRMALHFFLMQMPKFSSVGSESDSDEADPGRLISRLKHKTKHRAKTGKRERVLKNKVDALKKRFDQGYQEDRAHAKQLVDPVRLLQDPQGFAERLLAKLHKTAERFEVRILMMSVLARVVNEHELVLLGVFPLLERYLEPTQLHATNILALASTCVHKMVPPDALESFVRTIADRFVNDRSDRDSITIGINTIREICKRQPLAMNSDLLTDLVGYKQRRGERGVIMAARSLLQLYREVNPELLPPKLRGSKTGPTDGVVAPRFGAEAPLQNIPGLEALFGNDDANSDIANSDDLSGGSSNIEFSSDDGSGEWEMVSHDSDEDFSESADSDDDAVPQLVPIKGAAPAGGAAAADDDDDGDDADDEESDDDEEDEEEAMEAGSDAAARPSKNGFVAADDMWVESGDDEDDAANAGAAAKPPTRKQHRREEPSASSSDDEENDEEEEEEGGDDDDDDDDGEELEEMEEDDEEDDGDDSSGSGEWVDVSQSDDDGEAEDASVAAPSAPGAEEWHDDIADAKTRRAHGQTASTVGKSSGGKASVATMRTLTDDEFAKLRIAQQGGSLGHSRMKSKALEKQQRMSRKDALVRDLGERGQLLDASAIETFTDKKRDRDRDRKVEEAKQKRLDNNPFQARKKKKTKLNTTHREKQKVGKLYQMTKRSGRVAQKLKRSVEERRDHAKDMKKKTIKFRIARGWKA